MFQLLRVTAGDISLLLDGGIYTRLNVSNRLVRCLSMSDEWIVTAAATIVLIRSLSDVGDEQGDRAQLPSAILTPTLSSCFLIIAFSFFRTFTSVLNSDNSRCICSKIFAVESLASFCCRCRIVISDAAALRRIFVVFSSV